jgi:hypothetical protein
MQWKWSFVKWKWVSCFCAVNEVSFRVWPDVAALMVAQELFLPFWCIIVWNHKAGEKKSNNSYGCWWNRTCLRKVHFCSNGVKRVCHPQWQRRPCELRRNLNKF